MMRPKSLLLILLMSAGTSVAHALSVDDDTEQVKNYLTASGEYTSFTLPAGSLSGEGIHVDFAHSFGHDLNFDFYLSTAFSSQNVVTASFTGVGGYFYYNLLGDQGSLKRTVSVDGAAVLVEKKKKTQSLQLGVGFDQIFLNGTQAVYSVSGVGVGAKYQFFIFSQNFEVAGRYSMMSSNNMTIQGLFLSVGMVFPL